MDATMAAASPVDTRPRVVIVGAGFGGLVAARALRKVAAKVTVIDRRNYHLFQPLLYQVATAGLSPADIASPIRGILRDQANAEVLMARVTGVDRARREVMIDGSERRIPYDYLIIAAGARHAYFGHDEWEDVAPGLKKIDDATAIRHRILVAFEKAETTADPEERRRLLTFVIVGGGPTGVEMAGAIAELAKMTLVKDFRTIDPASARVILVEGGPRVLLAFPEDLSAKARHSLEKLGVEVLTNTPVELCDAGGVVSAGMRIEARTILWAAGVQAAPAAKWLQADKDRAGRVKVNPDLTVPGEPDIFVIGDNATVVQANGQPVPGVAPAAKQMGQHVARVIAGRIAGKPVATPFRYRNYGNFATIGRHAAVADFGWLKLSGYPAWLLWGAAHIYFLIGFRNRLAVMLDWLWAYVTFQRGVRLITGSGSDS
ncbi:MAG TPA: NAD(P)/FAD-dependent oxidoreductase [Candidatus Angelobacter sp.]|nr:NAD(P)/FAD-dependent oxidoreductase [Candidatus Angelobacter sp.]